MMHSIKHKGVLEEGGVCCTCVDPAQPFIMKSTVDIITFFIFLLSQGD